MNLLAIVCKSPLQLGGTFNTKEKRNGKGWNGNDMYPFFTLRQQRGRERIRNVKFHHRLYTPRFDGKQKVRVLTSKGGLPSPNCCPFKSF
jgi:hypothetical protein